MAKTRTDKVGYEREVMRLRVMDARIRAGKLTELMGSLSRELGGTGEFVPAYERYLETRKTEAWLSGWLDSLGNK
jgi:hypothetical protein